MVNSLRFFLSFLFVVSVSLNLISCSDSDSNAAISSPDSELGDDIIEGMVYVQAKGKKATLGTSDSSAKTLERPQMGVNFTYDFYMGRHEVLCRDFEKVMHEVTGITVSCKQDSVPISDVTFYDAVLYANALSKENGLDTAYTYTSYELNGIKRCVSMKGFKFNPASNGFRLPTEAEWIFVASKNWKPELSWNGENSGATAHKVCSSNDPKKDFCDLAGNLLEFVNDRYSSFKDTLVSDFVGFVDGDGLGTCVVKGGSYYSVPSAMKLYSRGDTYPVLGSSRGDYIGFRLARGPIHEATWFADGGRAVSTPITPLVNVFEVRSLTNSFGAKLVFRNDADGNLVYVDFSKNSKVVQIEDSIDSYHPDVSPDGKRVAFCTSIEGSSKESSVYVRDLNETGSNLVKLPVENAAIPRWRVNPDGDTVIVYVTSAGNNKGEQFFEESTWQVRFANGRFGTPEKLFDGAYHGGVTNDNRFAVSSSPLLRAHMAEVLMGTDVVWYNGEQACNASLSKDGTKRTIFLDFGGTQGRDFVGVNYGVHQRLLVADSTGHLLRTIASPEGYTFDHSEWAVGILNDTASNLVVATLTDGNGIHRQIALVNVNNGDIVPLVGGEELWHPCLWVWQDGMNNPKPTVDADSAGAYYDSRVPSEFPFSQVETGMRLQAFWKNYKEIEVATFGSSMLLNAIIEDSIKSFKAVNMGVSLSDIYLHDYLIRHYIIPYAPKIKFVVIELSPGMLYRSYEEMTGPILQSSPGIQYDEKYLNDLTKDQVAELSQEQQFPQVLVGQQYIEGTFLLPSGEWGVAFTEIDLSTMTMELPVLQYTLKMIESLKKTLDSEGIQLVAAITPSNPKYKDTEAFSLFGPSWDIAHKIIKKVEDMGVVIFDEYKDGNHDYTDEMAYNTNHLSYLGAAQFSTRLDAFLKTLK